MDLSKEDFVVWKHDPVTQAVFKIIEEQIEGAKNILAVRAGQDPLFDKTLVGLIKGYRNLLEITYDDVRSDDVSDSTPSQD